MPDCMASSVDDFPDDLFDLHQRNNGAIIFHLLLALYCFTMLAIVCNDYFLPSVDCICTG
jgi:sodium/potassium/calcium exchanger 5